MHPLQASNASPAPSEHSSKRNVPFLLNGAERKADSISDCVLWTFAGYFRRKRFEGFGEFLSDIERIIDFGGTPSIWTSVGRRGVVLLNLGDQEVPPDFAVVKGDGRKTSFPDRSFDLAFSNSTIEHVGSWEDQQAFALELCRVGKRVYCQTPARRFFFEPHYFTPFVDWCHLLLKHYWFVRYCTYYGLRWKPSREQVKDFQSHLRLLTYSEMQQLFPNCKVHRERFLGMTKAYIAIR